MKSLVLLISLLSVTSFATEHEIGHGGSPVALAFVSRMNQAVTLLRGWQSEFPEVQTDTLSAMIDSIFVKAEPKVLITGPDGKELEVMAANEPDLSPRTIHVSTSLWSEAEKRPDGIRDELATALHELLGIAKLEDNKYPISSRFRTQLDKLPIDRLRTPEPTAPVLLFEYDADPKQGGLDYREAHRICHELRNTYEEKYYLVYCSFHEQSWKEIVQETAFLPDYEFMGYVTQSGEESESWGWYRRKSSWETTQPVIVTRYEPVTYDHTIVHRVYGVRVYGLGEYATTPWKTVYSSLSVNQGEYSYTYPEMDDAQYRCHQVLFDAQYQRDDKSALYYRARCFEE